MTKKQFFKSLAISLNTANIITFAIYLASPYNQMLTFFGLGLCFISIVSIFIHFKYKAPKTKPEPIESTCLHTESVQHKMYSIKNQQIEHLCLDCIVERTQKGELFEVL